MQLPVHTLDLQYLGVPRSIASFLVIGPKGHALVETGPASTVEALTKALAVHGLRASDISDALVTHIHLDHAGAAGWLAQHGATIHVHEFGAPHLVDPSRLIASARRIYGGEMERLWGEIVPVPPEQVRPLRDADVVPACGLDFRAIETPGHARHHHAFEFEHEGERICFTGDAAAMIVPDAAADRASRFIALPTPPPEFDPDAWLESLAKLERRRFDRLLLTHFGEVDDAAAHLEAVRRSVIEHWEFVRGEADAHGEDEATILSRYRTWVLDQARRAGISERQRRHFVSDRLLAMNVAGMMRRWGQARAEC